MYTLQSEHITNLIQGYSKEIAELTGERLKLVVKKQAITPEQILEHVCHTLDLSLDYVRSKSRKTERPIQGNHGKVKTSVFRRHLERVLQTLPLNTNHKRSQMG